MSTAPVRKRQKRDASLDADAKLAAELQAQENRMARSTRGGSGGAVKKRKKVAKKKSEKRVRGSDESEGSGAEAPKRKAGGGFQKPFNLSPQLAEVCGETQVCF